MGIDEILMPKRGEILRLVEKHGAKNLRVFGSVARGEAGPDSDVDFLVELGPRLSPFFPGGLVADLEDLLSRHIEIVTENGLHKRLRARVLQEARPL